MPTSSNINISGVNTTPQSSKKQPFTSSERELIVALVRERPILEDKRTHARNVELKKQAWEELTLSYNAQPYVHQRNTVQLKRCWENIKTLRKKELSQESVMMKLTGGGPPQNGSTSSSDNVIDIICPFINLKVPEVIDSNSIEITGDLKNIDYMEHVETVLVEQTDSKDTETIEINRNHKRKKDFLDSVKDREVSIDIANQDASHENELPQPKKRHTDIGSSSSRKHKFSSEIEARVQQCSINIQQDKALHELRMQRENILIERETNLLQFEREMHSLQLEKLKLELEKLKKENKN